MSGFDTQSLHSKIVERVSKIDTFLPSTHVELNHSVWFQRVGSGFVSSVSARRLPPGAPPPHVPGAQRPRGMAPAPDVQPPVTARGIEERIHTTQRKPIATKNKNGMAPAADGQPPVTVEEPRIACIPTILPPQKRFAPRIGPTWHSPGCSAARNCKRNRGLHQHHMKRSDRL